jgi:hypothetical protein
MFKIKKCKSPNAAKRSINIFLIINLIVSYNHLLNQAFIFLFIRPLNSTKFYDLTSLLYPSKASFLFDSFRKRTLIKFDLIFTAINFMNK